MHCIRCCFLSCISGSTALLALARSRCEKRSGVGSHGPALQPGAALLAPVDCHCLQDLMRSTPSHGAAGNLHFACVRLSSLALPPKLLAEPCPAQVPSTSPWPWVGNWAPSQHCLVPAAFFARSAQMRRRWASQSAQRNALFNHELNSSPPRSADLSTQPAATSSQEAQTSPRPRSSPDSPDHLRQRGDSPQSGPAQHNMSLASDDLAVEDGYPAQPLTTRGFAKQRALQFRPKPPPKPKAKHGPLPTVADLAVGPHSLKTSPRPVVKYPAPQCTAQALAAPPPAKKSRISPELQCGGLPPPPTPPLPRSISGVGFSIMISEGSSSKSPAAQPRPLPSAQPALLAPKPRRVKVSSVRKSLATRMQTCGTVWLQLVYKLASASILLVSVSTTAHASEHLLAVIRSNAPGTLERYLRIASLFILFLESSATSFLEVSLASCNCPCIAQPRPRSAPYQRRVLNKSPALVRPPGTVGLP